MPYVAASVGRVWYEERGAGAPITAPTLLVWGDKDPILPMSVARQTLHAIPGAVPHTFDTGHVVFASEPDGFADVVEPFIKAAHG
jgi:pimeloyl-ACP methyl ester carboxylesterase